MVVYNEILSLCLPLIHPAVLAEVKKREAIDGEEPPPPKELKQAPMMELALIFTLEAASVSRQRPWGLRVYAATSLRFADTKVVYTVWRPGTAICGRSLGLKKKPSPIITWPTPKTGFKTDGARAHPFMDLWNKKTRHWKAGRAAYFIAVILGSWARNDHRVIILR